MERLVWYASYGSNLSASRFEIYLTGGSLGSMTARHRGARDPSPPRSWRPIEIPHHLYFAGHASSWGGAPAFVGTDRIETAHTRGRAYLITWEQLEDVVSQENGHVMTRPISWEPRLGESLAIGSGRYENMLCVAELEGTLVVTFTNHGSMEVADVRPPSVSYLRTIVTGLRETHGMADAGIVAYLSRAPGCSEPLARLATEAP